MAVVAADAVVPAVPGYWSYAPLRPEAVRWYYLRVPLSLKGYYEQDILHRAHLQRLCAADSLSLERAFQQQREALEKLWWEEQAELGARTLPAPKGAASPPIPDAEDASADWQDYFLGQGAGDEVGLPVRSGLYEVDLRQRRLKACYWPEASHRVLRGTWFLEKAPDWVALKEATADELEEAYRSEVWARAPPQRGAAPPQGARVELRTLSNEAKGWFALFVSESEAYLCRDDSLSWLSRKLTPGSGAPGARLRRGWQPPPPGVAVQEADAGAEAADEAAAGQAVAKLLLVVHGIGQNLAGSDIAGDAAAVQAGLAAAAAELPERERVAGRVAVLPVQWRKHLSLDADAMADALMPPGVRALRMMLHSTAVEVLLYLTPLHCQDMLDSLVDSLNLQFARFQRRNPGFQGEVSILAHSLGSVLCYDVLCSQPHLFAALPAQQTATSASDALQPLASADLDPEAPSQEGEQTEQPVSLGTELEALRQENTRLRAELAAAARRGEAAAAAPAADPHVAGLRIKPLAFAVDVLVAAGSPLGIFLTLRRVNPNRGRGLGTPAAARLMPGAAGAGGGDGLPAVRRLYNLYHPFDPVGFRLEPLITPGAERRRPVYAAYYKGGRRLHVGLAELSEDVSAAVSAGAARATTILQQSLSSLKLTGRSSSAKNLAGAKEPAAVETRLNEAEEAEEAGVARASHGTDSAVWRLTEGRAEPGAGASRSAKGRLDFVLQSGNVENPWLSAMSSHFAYWASADVALFVLRALYGHDVRAGPPREAPAPASPAPAAAAEAPASPPAASPAPSPAMVASPVLSPRAAAPRGLSDPEDWW